MKRLFLLALVVLMITSCSQQIESNGAAFQGVKDSVLFKGFNNSAVINDDGSLAIRGSNGLESVRLLVTSLNQTNVIFGPDALPGNTASYTSEEGVLFTTNNGNASGQVSVEINGDNTVSGTYNFVALTANSSDTVTFSRGFIYEVPILGELSDDDPVPAQDSFTARINTVIYNPTVISTSVTGGVLVVSGNTADRSMSLVMPENIAAGTYDITFDGAYTAGYTTPSGVSSATTGSLTIVSNDTADRRITADFIFDTPDGFIITDGQFSVDY